MAPRSDFAHWRAETRAWLMAAFANRMFRKGNRGSGGFLRRWVMPAEPGAPLDPDLEHLDLGAGQQKTVVAMKSQDVSRDSKPASLAGIPGGFPLALILTGCVFLVLGWPILEGRVYLDADLAAFYLPNRQFYSRALIEGWSLLWSPMQFLGFYLHGEGQLGLYHPANLLGYSWLPFSTAFSWELLRNYVFALPGMFLFLRMRNLPRDASLMGALLFTFCAFNSMHFMHLNGVASLAHAPWELLMVHLSFRGNTARVRHLAGIGLALLVSSTLMMGHPQFAWLALALAGLYTVLLLVEGARWGRLLGIVAGVALGFLLAGLQLLPQLEALGDSVRSDPSQEFVNSYSIQPAELTQYVQPYLFRGRSLAKYYNQWNQVDPERAGYAGCFGLLAILWIILRGRRMDNLWPIGAFAVLLFFLATDLTLGFDGVSKHLEGMLPLVGKMRAPSRYLAWVNFAAALAVAVFFADLCRATATGATGAAAVPRRMYALWLVPILSLAVTVAWYLSSLGYFFLPGAKWIAAPQMLVAGVVLVGLATSLIFAALRGWKVALYAIMVLAAIDVCAYGPWTMMATRTVRAEQISVPSSEELLTEGRVLALPGSTTVDRPLGRQVGGYVALTPLREFLWLDLLIGFAGGPGSAVYRQSRNALRVLSVGGLASLELPPALPRARLVAKTQVSDKPASIISWVDVLRVGITKEELDLDQERPGTAEIERDLPGDIQIHTNSPGRQLLVLSEAWHRGWQASVDGEPARVLQTYGDIMGVVVSGGPHDVLFKFAPASFAQGKAISLLGLLGILVWLGVAFTPGKRNLLFDLEPKILALEMRLSTVVRWLRRSFGRLESRKLRRLSKNLFRMLLPLLLLGIGACERHSPLPAEPKRPNILVYLSDTLRADHLSTYGYRRETSPRLTEFAATGILFERAYSQASWTKASVGTLFTGLYPSRHGAIRREHRLRRDVPVLAEVLQREGYRTAAVISNPSVLPNFGFGRGFEEVIDLATDQNSTDALDIHEHVLGFLEQASDRPFFLYVHAMDPHYPYAAPRPFDDHFVVKPGNKLRDRIAAYDNEIAYADHAFGALLTRIDELGLTDETVVVFLSDHGEEFDDHGALTHGYSLYQEQLHIPLIMRLAHGQKAGLRVADPVRVIDLFPALLDIAGAPIPVDIDAENLMPLLEPPSSESYNPVLYSEQDLDTFELTALIVDSIKVIRRRKPSFYAGVEVYDLARDSGEQRNLRAARPKLARRMVGQLDRMERSLRGGLHVDLTNAGQADSTHRLSGTLEVIGGQVIDFLPMLLEDGDKVTLSEDAMRISFDVQLSNEVSRLPDHEHTVDVDRLRFAVQGSGATLRIEINEGGRRSESFGIALGAEGAPAPTALPWVRRIDPQHAKDFLVTNASLVQAFRTDRPHARIYLIPGPPREEAAIGPELDARLKALGYLGDD